MNEIDLNLSNISDRIQDDLQSAGRSFLSIGSLLSQAREICPDVISFYNWVENGTCIRSRRTALAYMQVFGRFQDMEITGKVGYSILQELVSATKEVVELVEGMADRGEDPTVREVRDIVRADSPPAVRTNADIMAARDGNVQEVNPYQPSWKIVERLILELPEERRVVEADNCWNVIGLSQYFENVPSVDTVSRIINSLMADYEHKSSWGNIKKAINDIGGL